MQPRILIILVITLVLLVAPGCSEEKPELEPLEGDIRDIAGDFLSEMVQGRYGNAYAFFNQDMLDAISEEELQVVWEQMGDHVGSYQETLHKRHQVVDGNDTITITARFDIKEMEVFLVFSDNNRISGLWLNPER